MWSEGPKQIFFLIIDFWVGQFIHLFFFACLTRTFCVSDNPKTGLEPLKKVRVNLDRKNNSEDSGNLKKI